MRGNGKGKGCDEMVMLVGTVDNPPPQSALTQPLSVPTFVVCNMGIFSHIQCTKYTSLIIK